MKSKILPSKYDHKWPHETHLRCYLTRGRSQHQACCVAVWFAVLRSSVQPAGELHSAERLELQLKLLIAKANTAPFVLKHRPESAASGLYPQPTETCLPIT